MRFITKVALNKFLIGFLKLIKIFGRNPKILCDRHPSKMQSKDESRSTLVCTLHIVWAYASCHQSIDASYKFQSIYEFYSCLCSGVMDTLAKKETQQTLACEFCLCMTFLASLISHYAYTSTYRSVLMLSVQRIMGLLTDPSLKTIITK